jgi:hypothetical protein
MPHKTKIGAAAAYFENVVMQFTGDDCLIWPFTRNNMGYGRLSDGYAHIKACERAHGPKPTSDHEVAHSCGNGHLGCVTKGHLSWKTHAENEADKLIHGTVARGERQGNAKLTADQVAEIFELKIAGELSQRAIADKMGVSPALVCYILKGKLWARALPRRCVEGAVT